MSEVISGIAGHRVLRKQMSPLCHFGHSIIEHSVPYDQRGPGGPVFSVVLRKSFHNPEGGLRDGIDYATRTSPEKVVLEDVG